MKTSEFNREVQSLGYETTNLKRGIVVNDDNGFFLAYVSKEEFGVFSTDFPGFSVLDNYDRLQLLDSLVMYAKTHVSEREEEKKYQLRQIGVHDRYLIWLSELEFWTTGSSYHDDIKTVFTQEEIDNLPECYTHPAVWEKVEVTNHD